MKEEIRATYRLQLHGGFGFEEAENILGYLRELGVSHAYCSPYLQASAGSLHGYDVVDFSRVNEELGGEKGWERLMAGLKEAGLGQVLDIVPNHMSISTDKNRWWWDVLEWGQESPYAAIFDVDWDPPQKELKGKILLPVLGKEFTKVLQNWELRLRWEPDGLVVTYYDHRYPVRIESVRGLVGVAAMRSNNEQLGQWGQRLGRMRSGGSVEEGEQRRQMKEEMIRLLNEDRSLCAVWQQLLEDVNADPSKLGAVLDQQVYRLAYWRLAEARLNYRRFFDINTLVGVRVEDETVFERTHERVLEWVKNGYVDGLRVDHPDGLRDPGKYLRRLRARCPESWIVVEKILEPGEELPGSWPVGGTTGYDFLNRLTGVLLDQRAEEDLSRFYETFAGEKTDFHDLVYEKKRMVLERILGSDFERLLAVGQAAVKEASGGEVSRDGLRRVLITVMACLPVYRTYVGEDGKPERGEDMEYLRQALKETEERLEGLDPAALRCLEKLLTGQVQGELAETFMARFQQTTGPAMAKGVEDTAFYCYHRFVALNEVGGNPGKFGMGLAEFHESCRRTAEEWPRSMLATSTHDTKRSEDVRARLLVLAEVPDEWQRAVSQWSERNLAHKTGEWPDRNLEYAFYQNLVGAWPIDAQRMGAYLEKASREAKVFTSWIDPVEAYDRALQQFVKACYADEGFLREVEEFVREHLLQPGRMNALSQTLIKMTAPGVPDVYQGTELWDLSLVDPDNRRPVDYGRRREALKRIGGMEPGEVKQHWDEGLPKLWVLKKALEVRRQKDGFAGSGYEALDAKGDAADHVVAFARGRDVVTVAVRFPARLNGEWKGTTLEAPGGGRWRNVLSEQVMDGATWKLSELLDVFPVALLVREGEK